MMKLTEDTGKRGRPATYCRDCDKIHRHSDGILFCKIYSFMIGTDCVRPKFCRNWAKRTGDIPDANRLRQELSS